MSFPDRGWRNRSGKMPLFTKAEVNRFIANSGKLLGNSHHSVSTSWKKGKTFLEDEWSINPNLGLAKITSNPVDFQLTLSLAEVLWSPFQAISRQSPSQTTMFLLTLIQFPEVAQATNK